MGKAFLKKTTSLLQAKRKRKRWQRTMISLSLVVAMVTSCLLIHPAITMERTAICGQEEHTHTKECYEHRLVCGKTEQSAVPATEEKVLNCSKAVHEHGEGCYDAEGQLVCTTEAHNHDDSCYQIIRTEGVEGHTHTDACYEDVLICGKQEHTHTEACYPKETEAATQAQTQAETAAVTETQPAAPQTETVTEAAKTETATEKAETEKATEAEKPEARTLTVKNGEYTIQVDCPADAKIPKNAVLSIREIKKNDSDYNSTYERAASVVLMKTAKKIETVKFFDLSISVDGKEIQPKAAVTVKITFTKPIQSPEGSEVRAIRLGDDADVLATNTNKANGSWSQITFKAKKLTVYATAEIAVPVAETAVTEAETSEVMMLAAEAEETGTEVATEVVTEALTEESTEAVTEEMTEESTEAVTEEMTEESTEEPDTEEMTEEDPATPHILTAEGSGYTVEVTYTTEAGIPEGAELQVREIAQGTAEYESYYQQAMAAVQEGDTTSISFARFFDISFVYEGEEIEPSAPVAVKITYADAVEVPEAGEVKSVHFGDEAEVLNVQTNEKNGAMDEVTFDAESFSVYGIVGTEDTSKTKTYRTTYTFQNDDGTDYNFTLNNNPANSGNETPTGTSTNKQIVKDGGQLLDVGTPTSKVDSSKKFLGWGIVGSNGNVDKTNLITLPYTVSMGSTTSDASIKLQAVYSTTIKITFYDADNTTILTVVDKEPNSTLDLSKYEVVPTSAEEGFLGWNTTKNNIAALDNMYTVPNTDISLYPVIVAGHWLRFDKNDNDEDPTEATYTSPVFVTGNVNSSVKPADPTRSGYTFAGWYENEQTTGNPYSFSETLTSSKTLYAKWTPNEVKYKVVYWQENPDDYGFSYKESEEKTGTAGTKTSTSSIANKYSGFHLHSNTETDRTDTEHLAHVTEEAVIKGDGTTVVNVYYDRDIYTVKFVNQANATNASYSKNNDGEYYQVPSTWYLNEGGTVFKKGYYKIGEPEGSNSKVDLNDSSKVTFTYYKRSYDWGQKKYIYTANTGTSYRYSRTGGSDGTIDELTITAKYGADISNLWPSRRTGLTTTYPVNWNVSSDDDSYSQASISTMPLDGFIFYFKEPYTSGGYVNTNYYTQDVTGGDDFTLDHTDTFRQGKDITWRTTSEDYYDLRGFTPIFKNDDAASSNSHGSVTNYIKSEDAGTKYYSAPVGSTYSQSGNNQYNLNFYYARNQYKIGFTPNDGKNTPDITHSYYYQASIANAAPDSYVKGSTTITASNGDTLTFDGWYDNPDGLGDEYDFTGKTMPANNIHLYGKWKPTTYTVTINPNGGTFPDGKTDNRVTEDVVFGSTISESDLGETSREGYDLIGWYIQKPDGTETVYDFSTPVTSDVTIIAHWRKTGSFGVKYINTDPTKTPETDGDTLKQDSNTYADLADVTVLSAPDSNQIPAGYEFTGWLYDGTLYKPGDTFTLDASKATTGTDIINVNSKDVNYVTLKAKYTKLDTTYIHYNINYPDGSGLLTNPEGITDNYQKNIPFNTTTILSSGAGFTRLGYILIGWNTKADGTGDHWNLSEKVGVDDVNGNELYAEWERVYVTVSFTKKGEQVGTTNTINLSGAQFTLENGTESDKKTQTSGSNGSVSFTGLYAIPAPTTANGTITLKEIQAPAGYVVATGNPWTVTYDITNATKGEDGKYYTTGTIEGVSNSEIVNSIKKTDITLKKVDQNGKALTGAEFTLTMRQSNGTDDNGSPLYMWTDILGKGTITVNKEDGVSITDLPDGTYNLTETKAPDGYIILNDSVEFSISNGIVSLENTDHATVNGSTITVKNTAGEALPNTGGSGTLPYTLGGLMLMSVAALMYGFIMRRRGRRLN